MKIEPQRSAKIFLIICVIFLVGTLLGVAGYLAKNKPVKIQQPQIPPVTETVKSVEDETANWKTYRNEEYGFEFKYPRTLTLSENNNYKSSEDQRLLQLNKSTDTNFITVSRFEIGKDQTFKDVIINNSWLPGGGPRHEDFSKFKLVKVGNNSYYYRYLCGSIGGPDEQGNTTCDYFYYYWLVKDQSVFEFELFDILLTNNKNLDFENPPSHLELKQILSTFRFIE